MAHSIVKSSDSSSCLTTSCGRRTRRKQLCSSSCKAPTKLRPRWRVGIVPPWSGRRPLDVVGHVRRARTRRREAAGEAGTGQVKAAPKKVHRTHFADKAAPKRRQDPIGLHEAAKVPMPVIPIVRVMFMVLLERNGI